MAAQANKGVNDVPQGGADTLLDIASDLEGSVGKVECLSALLGQMAEQAGGEAGALVLFHLMYSVQAIYREQRGIVDQLYAKAWGRA
jgi:hypothetical protein